MVDSHNLSPMKTSCVGQFLPCMKCNKTEIMRECLSSSAELMESVPHTFPVYLSNSQARVAQATKSLVLSVGHTAQWAGDWAG